MFHIKCLGQCKKPLCPLCRKQLKAEESVGVFGETIIQPLMLRVYGLPVKSVEYVLKAMDLVVTLATRGEETVSALVYGVQQFLTEVVLRGT